MRCLQPCHWPRILCLAQWGSCLSPIFHQVLAILLAFVIIIMFISLFTDSMISFTNHYIDDNVPRVIGRLSGHKALVNCIALEENGSEDFVASGSTDTTVRVGTIITLLSLLLQ